ncbi:MAG: FGGY family carbohydrate kinase [Mycetocola sp.]
MSTAAPSAFRDRHREPVPAIGIDIGSTNTKVALLGLAEEPGMPRELGIRSFRTPDAPAEISRAVFAAIHGLISARPRPPVAVGVASMAESGVVLDAEDRPVGPLVRWTAAGTTAPLFDAIGASAVNDLSRATGVPATPKVPLATWHRLQHEEPDRWRMLARWAGAADFVAFALTGSLATDHTLAGRTMAYRLPPPGDEPGQEFDHALLARAGLRPARMPRIVRPGDPVGVLLDHVAEATGLARGTPVYLAGHDHAVAAWAAGVREDPDAADSLGTTEALVRVAGNPIDRSAALAAGMSVTRTVAGDRECLLAGAAGGAMVARWIVAHPEKDADVLFRALEPEGPGDAFVLPYPRGRQTPRPDPTARERLIGTPETAGGHLRAILVGLCLQLRWMEESQNQILGSAPPRLTVVGGTAAHNAAWNRLKSRLVHTPLAVVGAHEPVASGAALYAAVRVGAAPADAVLPAAPIPSHPHPRADDLFRAFVEAATEPALSSAPGPTP